MFSRQNLQLLLPLGSPKPFCKFLDSTLGKYTKDLTLFKLQPISKYPSLPQAKLGGNPSSS